jgi:hypothetical protein
LPRRADRLTTASDDRHHYDALDEALMETFPASDPIAVSAAMVRPEAATEPTEAGVPLANP